MEVALQRLMIIASDLGNEELLTWTETELQGYSPSDTLPEYRNIHSTYFVYSGINGGGVQSYELSVYLHKHFGGKTI